MHKRVIGFIIPMSLAVMLTAGNVMATSQDIAATSNAAIVNEDGQSIAASNGEMVITEAGTYTLTGSMKGAVRVRAGSGDVRLVLDGVTIDGVDTAGIIAEEGTHLIIEVKDGTANTIIDGGDDAYSAAICSDADISFEGNGQLVLACAAEHDAVSAHNGYTVSGCTLIAANGAIDTFASNDGKKAVHFTLAQPANEGQTVEIKDNAENTIASFTAGENLNELTVSSPSISADSKVYVDGTIAADGGTEVEEAAVKEENSQKENTSAQNHNRTRSGGTGKNQKKAGKTSGTAEMQDAGAGQSDTSAVTESETGTDTGVVVQPGAENTADESTDGTQNAGNTTQGSMPEGMPAMPDGQFPGGEWNGEEPPAKPEGDFQPPMMEDGTFTRPGGQHGGHGTMPGGQNMQNFGQAVTSTVEEAGKIVKSSVDNTALDLEADYENATTVVVSDKNSQVKITESGTYIVTGSADDGNIVVKKGTTGVVLVLNDLDLTSTTGATLSVNKEAEVKIIVSGNVVLTDAENPEDEESTDAEAADAFDGAAIKVKADSVVCITGDGSLTLNGEAKNGIKGGDNSSIVIDGDVAIDITAANDGINTNYDLSILGGEMTIDAEDDAVHADHILTVGNEDGTGPDLTIASCTEGLEGTVVNIFGGTIDITSSDDAVNAANKDALYEDELEYSINMTGGDLTVNSGGDGLDSNGNINLVDGTANINSSVGAGEAGMDYDGDLYLSDDYELNNDSGVSGPDMMPGGMGGNMMQPGQNGWQNADQTFGQNGEAPQDMGNMPMPGGMESTGMPGAGMQSGMGGPQGMSEQVGQAAQSN